MPGYIGVNVHRYVLERRPDSRQVKRIGAFEQPAANRANGRWHWEASRFAPPERCSAIRLLATCAPAGQPICDQRERCAGIGSMPAGRGQKRRHASRLLDAAMPHDGGGHGRNAARGAEYTNVCGVDPRLKGDDRFCVSQVIVDVDHVEADVDRGLNKSRRTIVKWAGGIDYEVACSQVRADRIASDHSRRCEVPLRHGAKRLRDDIELSKLFDDRSPE